MEDTIWSLMNLTLTIDKYNAVKSCMINGAAAGPAAGPAAAGWNNVLTTATIRLNDLCMVGDNGNGAGYPAWVTRNDPVHGVFVQPIQAAANPLFPVQNQIVVAQPGSNGVVVRKPDQTELNLFPPVEWAVNGVQCMARYRDQTSYDRPVSWHTAVIVDVTAAAADKTVQVNMAYMGANNLTVSIYAIREYTPAEVKAAEVKAAAEKAERERKAAKKAERERKAAEVAAEAKRVAAEAAAAAAEAKRVADAAKPAAARV
jgi:hypothetical protein